MNILIPLNVSTTQSLLVEKEHTAEHLGSGQVNVLATPMMIALMEAAALETVQAYLPSGWTTVGTKVNVDHIRATPPGRTVTAEATLISRDDLSLNFIVEARDNMGVIGQGSHQRFIIEKNKFIKSFGGK